MPQIIIFMVVMGILTFTSLKHSVVLQDRYVQIENVNNIIQKQKLIKSAVEEYCLNETVSVDDDLPTMDDLINKGYLENFNPDNGFESNMSVSFNTSKDKYYEFVLSQNIDEDYALNSYYGTYKNNYFGNKPVCNTTKGDANYGDCSITIQIEERCKK